MVRLTKIYTRGGDEGQTSLGDGRRVAKHDARIEAIGAVDEANAAIGVARLTTTGEADAMLARIQSDLFDLGADLCCPGDDADAPDRLRIQAGQAERLEAEIDAMNGKLAPLDSFVLPGGSAESAHLHVARTTVRRAERLATLVATREPVNRQLLIYLNRLSDHLFVMARLLNDGGRADVLWVPGSTR